MFSVSSNRKSFHSYNYRNWMGRLASLFLFLSLDIFASTPSLEWRKLLHYHETRSDHWVSDVEDPQFFFHAKGRSNPELELKASIKAFSLGEKRGKTPVICFFPARFAYLRENFGDQEFPYSLEDCPKLQSFLSKNKFSELSLVFSSYYMGSPASAFGHTLLRLKKFPGKKLELLDSAVNFAAMTNGEGALAYAFKGLFGGFKGKFNLLPYFYKVREYNDFEARDLWSYTLNLDEEERTRFLYHLWEIGDLNFTYTYLTYNCSYQLLALIQVAKKGLDLTSSLSPYIIPIDTVKEVKKVEGLVTSIDRRESKRAAFFHRYNQLSKNEREEFDKGLRNKTSENSKILDLLIDYHDYKFAKDFLLEKETNPIKTRRALIATRANLPENIQYKFEKIPTPPSPESGHGSTKVEILAGTLNQKAMGRIRIRPAFHDLSDPLKGHPKYSKMDIMSLSLDSFIQEEKVLLSEFNLINVSSLHPWNELERKWSVDLAVGGERKNYEGCVNCFESGVYFGVGPTFEYLQGNLLLLPRLRSENGYVFLNKKIFSTLGMPIALYFRPWERVLLKAVVDPYRYSFSLDKSFLDWRGEIFYETSLNSRLSLSFSRELDADEFLLGAAFYF